MKGKKILAGIITAAIIAGASIGLVACDDGASTGNQSNNLSFGQLMGTSMATAVDYVPAKDEASTQGLLSEDESIVEKIQNHIAVISNFLNDQKPSTTITNVTEEDVDFVGKYEHKMIVKQGDRTFSFYYNEGNPVTETEVEEDEEDKTSIEEMETETNIKLDGVCVIGDTQFAMVGEKVTETSKSEDESEIESKFEAFIYYDVNDERDEEPTNGIVIKQEFEAEVEGSSIENENSLKYTIYKDGGKNEEFEIKFEIEDGEDEIVYESLRNGKTTRIKLERNGDLDKKIKVSYERDEFKVSFGVRFNVSKEDGAIYNEYYKNDQLIVSIKIQKPIEVQENVPENA